METIPPCAVGPLVPEHDWKDTDLSRHCRSCGLVWWETEGRRKRIRRLPSASGASVRRNPPSLISQLLERDGSRCTYCGRTFTSDVPPTKDHRITQRELRAMERQGLELPDRLSNLQLACGPCNNLRGDMYEWAYREGIENGTIKLP